MSAPTERDLDELTARLDRETREVIRLAILEATDDQVEASVRRYEAILAGVLFATCRLLWLTRPAGSGPDACLEDLSAAMLESFAKLEAAGPANEV